VTDAYSSIAQESATGDGQDQMAGSLGAGLDVLTLGATLTFTRYLRRVLPADGFVFWVRADILAPSSVPNSTPLNAAPINQAQVIAQTAEIQLVPGSLHHTTINQQGPDESFSLQKMIFTCQQPVDFLTAVEPDEIWIAGWENLKFAFSTRSGFFKRANTYHYSGDALYPSLATQVIDYPDQLSTLQVVSNSLPLWLGLATTFPLFPSWLVPDNQPPPYGAVHIGDDDTSPLAAAPYVDPLTGSRYQLTRDRVKITTFGVRNDDILDWIASVEDYTVGNPSTMGMMGIPIPRDAKRGQAEMSIIAQKKIIEFEVDYYQQRIVAAALQTIKSAFYTLTTDGSPALSEELIAVRV
jgi:hypothetical protein